MNNNEEKPPVMEDMSSSDGHEKYGDNVYNARVKWFNRQTGWGFLSLTSSAEQHENDDIFVHWKSLNVEGELYKYLVNGEYVTLNINYTPDGEHSYQATNVSGVDGGLLMCQTRHIENESRRDDENNENRSRQPQRVHYRGPREGSEWNVVEPGKRGQRQKRGRPMRENSKVCN